MISSLSSFQLQAPLNLLPEQVQNLYRQGVSAYHEGDWHKAFSLYQQVVQWVPEWAPVHYGLGVICDRQSRLEQAIVWYGQAIALNPSYAEAFGNLGCAYLKQGDFDQAIQALKTAIELSPQAALLWNNLGQALYAFYACNVGPSDAVHKGHLDAAINAYQRAIQLQPDLIIAHINLGFVWQQQELDRLAMNCFNAVLKYQPDHVEAHSHCAHLYFRQGQVEQAVQHWQVIATLQAHLLWPYHRQMLQSQERTDEVSPDLLQAAQTSCAYFLQALLERSPVSETGQWLADTYHRLGLLLVKESGYQQADYYCRQALRITPHQPAILSTLAKALAMQQRSDASIMLQQIVQMYDDTESGAESGAEDQSPLGMKVRSMAEANDSSLEDGEATAQMLTDCPIASCTTTVAWATTTAIASVCYQPVVWDQTQRASPQPISTPPDSGTEAIRCGGVTCSTCMADLRQLFEPYQVVANIYQCGTPDETAIQAIETESFATFTINIPQGRSWIAPQRNSWAICNSMAVVTPDRVLLTDLSRDYPWFLPGCRHFNPHQHRILKPGFHLPPVRQLKGQVAIFSGLSGHVYYHWMMDIVPRFGILRQSGWSWDDIDWFVVNSMERPFQRETLAILGIPDAKILESDRVSHLQADELVVPSFPGPLDWPPLATIEFLRTTFLAEAERVPPPEALGYFPPYFYISRAKASYRRVLNEKTVIGALQPLGFVAVTLEELSIKQQVHLFAQAQVIVAPHGAGLTNTVFCQPNTHVFELTSPNYVRSDYWIVSHHVGLRHYWVTGEVVACSVLRRLMYQNPLTEDFWIPSATLKAMLMMLRRSTGRMYDQ